MPSKLGVKASQNMVKPGIRVLRRAGAVNRA
jgi:hypothetical protein